MHCSPIAKLNLGLNVVARRHDGYHDIETVFYPVPQLHDDLDISPVAGPTSAMHLTVEGDIHTGPTQDNLVVRAYGLIARDFELPPVEAHLLKRIPAQAGLGGGSSDAAATLCLLNTMFALQLSDDDLRGYALRIGADCPFFIDPRPAYAEGVGERLTPIALDLSRYHIAILKPPFAVSTKIAFNGVSIGQPEHNVRDIVSQPVETWRGRLHNDFETTVFAIHNELAGIRQRLYDMNAIYAGMSGSGSAIYAFFDEQPRGLDTAFPMCHVFVS